MKVKMLCEGSTFSAKHWTHGGKYPKFDYLQKVLESLITGDSIKLGNNGTDGTISIDNFVEGSKEQFEAILKNIAKYKNAFKNASVDVSPLLNEIPADAYLLDSLLDTNSDLPPIIASKLNNNRVKGPIVWTCIYKQTFSGHDESLPDKKKKVNKGNAFEEIYKDIINTPGENNEKLQLQDIVNREGVDSCYFPDLAPTANSNAYYMGTAIKTGGANNKRPLTFVNNYLYFVPSLRNSSDIFDAGKTLSDVTVPLYNNMSKVLDGENQTPDASLYLSLKATSKNTFVNGGIVPILPAHIFNSYQNENNKNNLQSILNRKPIDEIAYDDSLNELVDFQHEKGNYLLDMLGINRIRFIDTYINYDERIKYSEEYVKRDKKNTPISIFEEVILDDEHAEQLRQFVMSTIGYGFILVHEAKKGVIECIDLRKKEQVGKLFIGHNSTDTIPVPLVKKVVVEYPAFHQAKCVKATIDYPNITLTYTFRSKEPEAVYPTQLMCDYKIKSIPE